VRGLRAAAAPGLQTEPDGSGPPHPTGLFGKVRTRAAPQCAFARKVRFGGA
jgi:hypothetical protein